MRWILLLLLVTAVCAQQYQIDDEVYEVEFDVQQAGDPQQQQVAQPATLVDLSLLLQENQTEQQQLQESQEQEAQQEQQPEAANPSESQEQEQLVQAEQHVRPQKRHAVRAAPRGHHKKRDHALPMQALPQITQTMPVHYKELPTQRGAKVYLAPRYEKQHREQEELRQQFIQVPRQRRLLIRQPMVRTQITEIPVVQPVITQPVVTTHVVTQPIKQPTLTTTPIIQPMIYTQPITKRHLRQEYREEAPIQRQTFAKNAPITQRQRLLTANPITQQPQYFTLPTQEKPMKEEEKKEEAKPLEAKPVAPQPAPMRAAPPAPQQKQHPASGAPMRTAAEQPSQEQLDQLRQPIIRSIDAQARNITSP